ncbi:MAG: glycosyltransferase family 39 protein, partial [Bryobacteraceae bacterium]
MSGRAAALLIVALVLCLRLPFLNQAIQGDDLYYLAAAEHAQIDPLHPNHARYVASGVMVDMRGHPHPPLDGWVLAALLALVGDVREVPFHAAYILFSLIAALSVWSLARRFTQHPLAAALLFLVTPAFVVNGGSLESDLPFLAFWLASIALFVAAIDSGSRWMLALSAAAGAMAALAAYQAVMLTAILVVYVWPSERRRWKAAWLAMLAAPIMICLWQLFERLSTGALPAAVLTGYMQSYGLQTLTHKLHNAIALTGHAAWLVGPLMAAMAFSRIPKWGWAVIGIA